MICFTQQKEAVMNVMLFSPNGPDVVVLYQNKAASYIYQNITETIPEFISQARRHTAKTLRRRFSFVE